MIYDLKRSVNLRRFLSPVLCSSLDDLAFITLYQNWTEGNISIGRSHCNDRAWSFLPRLQGSCWPSIINFVTNNITSTTTNMYNTNKYHTTTKTRPTRTTTTSSGAELPPLLKRTFQFSENRMAVSDLWSSLWGGSLSCLQSLPYSAWPLFQGATHQQF